MTAEYQKRDIWKQIPDTAFTKEGFQFETEEGRYYGNWKQERAGCEAGNESETGVPWRFSIGFAASYSGQLPM